MVYLAPRFVFFFFFSPSQLRKIHINVPFLQLMVPLKVKTPGFKSSPDSKLLLIAYFDFMYNIMQLGALLACLAKETLVFSYAVEFFSKAFGRGGSFLAQE